MVYETTGHSLFCLAIPDKGKLATGVTLAVYRREYDGTFVEIASGLQNLNQTFVVDPHPSLDFARYRIIATDVATGAVSYNDVPGYPIQEKSIIIQWDEKWSNFEVKENEVLEEPPWSGSLLKLPYNIDVSDTYNADVALIEYIGRDDPVSYYGTQKGITSSWNVDIVKKDVDTLYAFDVLLFGWGMCMLESHREVVIGLIYEFLSAKNIQML